MRPRDDVRFRSPVPSSSAHLPWRCAILAALAACSSGGGGGGEGNAGGDFVALRTEPTNGNRVFLNDPISVDFSNPVDLDSANLTTMSFQALDQSGAPTTEAVSGKFVLAKAAGDDSIGRRLQFVPRIATDDSYSNGGLRAGRTYLVRLVQGTALNGTVLRDRDSQRLAQPTSFSFTTSDGTQAAQLYRNPKPGGPARVKVEITNAASHDDVPLNLFGAPPIEVRLFFDQALNPASTNVPVALDTDPLVRNEANRGRIWLEYKDPVLDPGGDEYTWIPADVELETNDLSGSVVVLRPVGVLPNNAAVRIIVENTLEDVSGESNIGILGYNRVVQEFQTSRSYESQWNGIVEGFESTSQIDFGAAFPEAQAITEQGFLRAGFQFEGTPTTLEYEPTSQEVVLNTDFTQIVPKAGLPFAVAGGVFNFRNVTIPNGVTVLGQGSKPMVWLCSGDFRVSGTLSVRGGNGTRVTTLTSATYPKAGGIGTAGGGNGGAGTPQGGTATATPRDYSGQDGFGAFQTAALGGGGGRICCGIPGCFTGTGYNDDGGGSGGGGGSFATQGDPNWRGATGSGGISFQQRFGIGGAGCSGISGNPPAGRTATLAGGTAGPRVFTDARSDNDFWGSAINLATGRRITGEIAKALGGTGGGGGGDCVPNPGNNCTPSTASNPINDYSGGGGGGGGGILIVKALGEIEITRTGKIVADGGHGGGGEQAGGCGQGGGGGGGSGGMVVLMSAKRIILHQHGSPQVNRWNYSQNDYNFAVSADGGVTTTGTFLSSVTVIDKYPADGVAMLDGSLYDDDPLGGLGGMGIVQLMVPPGPNFEDYVGGVDGTNTALDDYIVVKRHDVAGNSTTLMLPGEKQKALAWRGFLNNATPPVATGDDGVTPITIGTNEGDIRPPPILMPVPFSAKSRARSKWIDTGASQRRQLAAEDDLPRGVVANETGPVYEFSGLVNTTDPTQPGFNPDYVPGYVAFKTLGASAVEVDVPAPVVAPVALASATAVDLTYHFTVAQPVLGQDNRYVQYEAEVLNEANVVLTGFRILSHTATTLVADAGTDVLPADAKKLQIRPKFFKIVTNGSEGFGPAYLSAGLPIPNAGVRIGFAFHKDPKLSTGRFPTNQQEFVYDVNGLLSNSAFLSYVGTGPMPRYVQWDVTFDLTYRPTGDESPTSLNPQSPRPELHFLRLPFRF